jgi:hypothetical protein
MSFLILYGLKLRRPKGRTRVDVFENKEPRRVFVLNRNGGRGKLRNEERDHLYSSSNIRVIKLRGFDGRDM